MQITLLAFAQARDVFGLDEKVLTLPDDEKSTPASVLDSLRPDWRTQLPTARAAVDLEYVEWDHPLADGQTLAVIPPVSGG